MTTLLLTEPTDADYAYALLHLREVWRDHRLQVSLDETDTAELQPHELRRRIGYVFQQAGLSPHMTVARCRNELAAKLSERQWNAQFEWEMNRDIPDANLEGSALNG